MADEIAGGVIRVEGDASQFIAEMAKMEEASSRAERAAVNSAGKAAGAMSGVGKGAQDEVAKFDSATQRWINSIERQIAQQRLSREEYLKYMATIRGVSDEVSGPFIKALVDAERANGGLASGMGATATASRSARVEANQLRAAYAQLPAQITDVATSLASGMPAWLVLVQQGGQINDAFGGIGNAAKALGPALLRFIANPVTLAAAAFVALAVAYKQGSEEADVYNRALVLSGNAAGTTIGQLNAMAKAVGDSVSTQGKAAEVLALLAGSGAVANGQLQALTESAIRMERAGGPAVAETVKQFTSLGRDPLQAILKLNDGTNFLTRSTFEQVKALQDQGRVAEAAAVAQNAYADAVTQRAGQLEARLGTLERGWRAVADGAKAAWDSMLNIGRADTIEESVAKAQKALDEAQKRSKVRAFSSSPLADTAGAQAYLDTQKEGLKLERQIAEQRAFQARQGQALKEADDLVTRGLSSQLKLQKDITAARTTLEVAGSSKEEIQQALTYITQTSAAFAQSQAVRLAAIEGEKQARIDASKAAEQEIQRQVALGNVSQFAAEREIAQLRLRDNQAQLDALQKQRAEVAKQREPFGELAKINNEIAAAQRERLLLLEREKHTVEDLVALGEKRQQSPAEQFRASENAQAQAIVEQQRQKQVALTLAEQDYAKALRYANEELALEAQLLGKSAAERSLALQQLKIEQEYREKIKAINAAGYEPAQRRQAIDSATANRDSAISNLVNKQTIDYVADLLDPSRPKSFGDALTDAFGRGGQALVGLTNSLEAYAAKQYQIETALKSNRDKDGKAKDIKVETALLKEQGELQLSTYANLAGAAKNFFAEGTKGYKALEAAETAFRVVQIASALQEGIAKAAVAIAHQGTDGDVYSAFPRMAAMAAIMASLGFATGFFGSSTSGANVATAAQRQGGAATGRVVTADQLDPRSVTFVRGTVLGDDTAKSESIAKNIELLADKASLSLPLTSSMLHELELIRDGIAGLGSVIARSVGGGITTGKNLDIQTGVLAYNQGSPLLRGTVLGKILDDDPILGGLRSSLAKLWGKTTQEIADSGLSIVGRVSDLIKGIGVQQFADVATTKSSFFGLKKTTTTNTVIAPVEDQIAQQFGLIFQNIGASLKTAAAALGQDEASIADKVQGFWVDIARLSLKGLKGQDLQDAISAAIGSQADTIAQTVLPGLDDFQKVGEGYYETLVRVASGVEEAAYQTNLLGIASVKYGDVLNKQGDVAAEIVRQSIELQETANGQLNNVGKLVDSLSGSSSEIATTYRSLVDTRQALINVGQSGEGLTAAMIAASGGLDKLQSNLATLLENFASPQQQAQAQISSLTQSFASLGFQLPKSREEFYALTQGIVTSSDAGQRLYASLVALAPAFDKLSQAREQFDATKNDLSAQLFRAQGNEFGAQALERQKTLIELSKLEAAAGDTTGSLQAMQRAIWGIADAADAAAQAMAVQQSKTKANLIKGYDTITSQQQAVVDQRHVNDLYQIYTPDKVFSLLDKRDQQFWRDFAAMNPGRDQSIPVSNSEAANAILGPTLSAFQNYFVGRDLANEEASKAAIAVAAQNEAARREQMAAASGGIYDDKTLQEQIDVTRALISTLDSLESQLEDFGRSLLVGDLSALSPEQQYAQASKAFDTVLAQSRAGDTAAIKSFVDIARTLLETSKSFNGGQGAFFTDSARVSAADEELKQLLKNIAQNTGQTVSTVAATGAASRDAIMDSNEIAQQNLVNTLLQRSSTVA